MWGRYIAALVGAMSWGAIQSAAAADLPARMPVKAPSAVVAETWTGLYIGVNAGYGWGKSTGSLDSLDPTLIPANNLGALQNTLGVEPRGFVGGGQVGYNWQTGMFVWGAEADFQYSDVKDTAVTLSPAGLAAATATTADSRLNWFGTARLRAGITLWPSVLLYVTGGAAYGRVKESITWVCTPTAACNFAGSNSDTRFGWTAGGGGEWALGRNWSLRAEYLYVDLGSTSVSITDPQFPTSIAVYGFDHRYHIARGALNYRF